MKRRVVMFMVAAFVGSVIPAFAQDARTGRTGAGRVEVNAIPSGGVVFAKSANGGETDLRNRAIGFGLTANVNRKIAV